MGDGLAPPNSRPTKTRARTTIMEAALTHLLSLANTIVWRSALRRGPLVRLHLIWVLSGT